jgi:hypothetical protein
VYPSVAQTTWGAALNVSKDMQQNIKIGRRWYVLTTCIECGREKKTRKDCYSEGRSQRCGPCSKEARRKSCRLELPDSDCKTPLHIYGLVDPRDGQVFYVGKTSRTLHRRLIQHIAQRWRPSATARAIARLWVEGYRPQIIELARLENPTFEEWKAAEQSWIDFYSLTAELTNTGAGGQGGNSSSKALAYAWTPEMDGLLGTQSDGDLAKQFGFSRKTVGNRRELLGVPKYVAPLKSLPEDAIALLGAEPDYAIAERFGLSIPIVRRDRERLGIPPHPNGWQPGQVSCNRKDLPRWVHEKMGTMPDLDLAKLAGVSQWAIWWRRRAAGIPSYAEQTGNDGRIKPGEVLNPRGPKTRSTPPHGEPGGD